MSSIPFGSFILFLILISSTAISIEETSIRTKAGGKVLLPCDISVPVTPLEDEDNSIQVILWFKDEGSHPIYAVDTRDRASIWDAKHWQPAAVDSRITFNLNSDPATLLIQKLKKEDAGVYRCRVDFRYSPTRNNKINLDIF